MIKKVLVFLLVALALPVGVYLVSQRQETREKAAEPTTFIVVEDEFNTFDTAGKWNYYPQNEYECATNCLRVGQTGNDLITIGARATAEAGGVLKLYKQPNCAHRFVYVSSKDAYDLESPFFEATVKAGLENATGWGVGWGVEGIFSLWYTNVGSPLRFEWWKPDGTKVEESLTEGNLQAGIYAYRVENKQLATDPLRAKFEVFVGDKSVFSETYEVTTEYFKRSGDIWFGNKGPVINECTHLPVANGGQCEGWESCQWANGTLDRTGAGPWPKLLIDSVKIYGFTPVESAGCQVALSPSVITLSPGESLKVLGRISSGLTSVAKVEYFSSNTSVVEVDYLGVRSSPQVYATNLRAKNLGSANIVAKVFLNPGRADGLPDCATASEVNVGQFNDWYQTKGGDIGAGKSIASKIPALAADTNYSMNLDGFPGVIVYGGSTNFGEGLPSQKKWLAKSVLSKRKNYEYFWGLLNKQAQSFGGGSLPLNSGSYLASGNLTLSGGSVGNSQKIMILSPGDITLTSDIEVAVGGLLLLASKGDIIFTDSVGKAEGIFVAGGQIRTGQASSVLLGEGVFVAGDFSFDRQLGSGSQTLAAETFVYRPDFWFNSFDLWAPRGSWQELAP